MNINPASETLSEDQRRFYTEQGYLQLDSFVGTGWLSRLKAAAAEFVEMSRAETRSGKVLDLAPGHSAETPRIRRLNSPVDHHETFRAFAIEGPAAALACDLLGGPVRFHHSKLNYKWSDGGEEIKWHQDIQFWPHTDFSPLTIGVYLDDVDDAMGPMGVLPGSHTGPLYDLYDRDGNWAGAMTDEDIATLELDRMAWLKGPAGSVTIHNCCMVHGSVPNNSSRPRPLLLQTYSAMESYPIGNIGANSVRTGLAGTVIGGPASMTLTIDGRSMRGAPDWSQRGGASPTIFGSQQKDGDQPG
ncbi:phytanoyl-CoA dioxygenase family protein [Minwuia sp.]|uniref:phytanoyl-CoA dioxygenase family protein n=1 Tax=Minwuia sp. TaxID=2493630 RepID=UPI003A90C818